MAVDGSEEGEERDGEGEGPGRSAGMARRGTAAPRLGDGDGRQCGIEGRQEGIRSQERADDHGRL